jgi:16S rRNA (uracil1498-N3)-methyltransferase
VAVTLSTCLKDTEQLADIWLVLAPLKNKDAFDNAIRHAVELGVGRIVLVQTERTQASKINLDRLRQQIIDAAQQCGRLSVPDVTAPVSLKNLLAGWPTDRSVFACIEAADAVQPIGLAARNATACAVLIGPEGGFSENEKIWLMSRPHPALQPVSLGSLILRSDTAVAASLSACILKQ